MEPSSRIFIKGLPPNIKEAELRKHFSAGNREITDVKLIPQRRIGYVGYKTAEDAAKAVRYFNKSYVRMSKISVESAKPVGSSPLIGPGPVSPSRQQLTPHGMLDLRPYPEQAKSWTHPSCGVLGQKEIARRIRRGQCCLEEEKGE